MEFQTTVEVLNDFTEEDKSRAKKQADKNKPIKVRYLQPRPGFTAKLESWGTYAHLSVEGKPNEVRGVACALVMSFREWVVDKERPGGAIGHSGQFCGVWLKPKSDDE